MNANPEGERVPISFGHIRPLLVATGMLQRWSYIDISENSLTVRMSWAFQAVIPLASIKSVHRITGRRPLSIGVHGWAGRWLVNGSRDHLVMIDIEPTGQAQVIGFSVNLRQLTVSVDDPDSLMTTLERAIL